MLIERLKEYLKRPPELSFNHGNSLPPTAWSRRLREMVKSLMMIDRVQPLRVRSVNSEKRGGLWCDRYIFAEFGGTEFKGVLLRPSAEGSYPVVLICPGRNAAIEKVTAENPVDFPDQNVATQLAFNNMATFTLEYGLIGGFERKKLNGRDEVNLLAQAMSLLGKSPLGFLVENALSGLQWIKNQPWFKPGEMAIFGRSLGGFVALHTALVHDEPMPTALTNCVGHYYTMFVEHLNVGGANALPGIMKYADLPDLIAALAPAPLHIQQGMNDEYFPVTDARDAMALVKRSYDAVGAGDQLDFKLTNRGHGTDVEKLITFLESRLFG